MDGQKLSKKVVPKMEAQKLSKKKFQNGNPKTFQKNVVPKMETQKLSKKKWFPKWKAKNFPKKWFPKWFPFIRHWLGSWALGFYLEDTFGMCFLGPGILSLTCSFWSHFGISQALGFLAQKPFAVIIFILGHAFYHGVSPGILARAFWPQTSWILSQHLA